MSEPKWTPGPWRVMDSDYSVQFPSGRPAYGVSDGPGELIADAYLMSHPGGTLQAKANGHLIAAAPDLYAILQQMTGWASGPDAVRLPAPWPEMVATANAVMAKARGEAK